MDSPSFESDLILLTGLAILICIFAVLLLINRERIKQGYSIRDFLSKNGGKKLRIFFAKIIMEMFYVKKTSKQDIPNKKKDNSNSYQLMLDQQFSSSFSLKEKKALRIMTVMLIITVGLYFIIIILK